jgi:hypothetical protein
MLLRKFVRLLLFFLCALVASGSAFCQGVVSHKLALGAAYGGGQIHWGLAKKWAMELRGLKGKQTGNEGEVSSTVIGVRGYRYFRPPSRIRFYLGLEAASTRGKAPVNNYQTTGVAIGGFAGTEIYLMKRLSVGVDIGPYSISTRVRRSATSDQELYIVINSFMNFYFL